MNTPIEKKIQELEDIPQIRTWVHNEVWYRCKPETIVETNNSNSQLELEVVVESLFLLEKFQDLQKLSGPLFKLL